MSQPPIRLPLKSSNQISLEDYQKRLTAAEKQALVTSRADATAPLEQVTGTLDDLLQDVVTADQQAMQYESPVPPDAPKITLDEKTIVPVEKLSAQRQEEIRKQMESLSELEKLGGSYTLRTASAIPGMDDAFAAADTPTIATESARPNNVIQTPEAPGSETGIKPALKACPRCKLDLEKADKIEPSREEWLGWLASLHGARFKKAYLHYKGMMRIVFRSLTTAEGELAIEQTQLDLKDTPNATVPMYLSKLFEYRRVLSLESISFADGRTLVVPTERILSDTAVKGTRLPELLKYVRDTVTPSEGLYVIVGRRFQEFQRLVEWLEAAELDAEGFTEEISGGS